MYKLYELPQEDLKYICGCIPPSRTRRYFQKYPKEFAKIRSGFRAEKLSDADTISTLVRNISNPFISSFIEHVILEWLGQIQENLVSLQEEGYSEGEALLKTMPDSVFCDNCELFFKLSDRHTDKEYVRLFKDAVSYAQKVTEETKAVSLEKESESDNSAENAMLLQEANTTISELRSCLEEQTKQQAALQDDVAALNAQVESDKALVVDLRTKLDEAKGQLIDVQNELDHYKHLANYADEEFEENGDQQFHYVSIGEISHDYNGQIWINRLADIIDGEISPFLPDDSKPHYFENRDRLYWKNGPGEDGDIAIWSWRADQRDTDHTRDYITSEYNRNARVTEVVELPQCKTLTDIAKYITDWFERQFKSEKVLFVCTTVNGIKEGLLCSPGNLEFSGSRARLAKSVFMLPHYTVKATDTIAIAGIRVFRKMNLGIPQSVYRVRTPSDVIKEMLLTRASITSLRENGWSKRDAQRCRGYIEKIPTQTLVQELSDAYACTETEAQEYIDSFISNVNAYLTASDFDMQIFSIALERNQALVERCKEQLSDEWRTESTALFEAAQDKLRAAEEAKEREIGEVELLIRQKEELSDAVNKIQRDISSKEQLAKDVEDRITKRIEEAKQNVAEFISQMAFVSGGSSTVLPPANLPMNRIYTYSNRINTVASGEVDDLDTFEEELTDNFETMGYDQRIAIEMAQAVTFCICNRIPIVVGANASPIGQCIAATIHGGSLAEIIIPNQDIGPEELLETIKTVEESYQSNTMLIHGVFDGYGISTFNVLISLLRMDAQNRIIILSTEGIPVNMIPASVWGHAFYIDGDEGLQSLPGDTVRSFDISFDFKREHDREEFMERRKELLPFSTLLSNSQRNQYAMYLSEYNVKLCDSWTVLNQMVAVARSSGKEELLSEVFHENAIATGEKIISTFL